MARGKKYRKVLEKVDSGKNYPLQEAIALVKEMSYSKFVGAVDLAVNLGVDPRHAEQNVRGAVALPHGRGKVVRIVVFAKGQKAIEANDYGVEQVGGEDLAQKIQDGWLDFDQVVATPDMMGVVGKLGKVLGPRGLMPNPKMGTVTFELKQAIQELKAGRAEFKVDKAGIVHTAVGRVDMDSEKLKENVDAVIEALVKAKPSTAKGTYLKKVSLSATMSPGVKVDTTPYRT
ncbi:MAG: 50S ribosomal protein L1 [Deltaproteobacteria bacterium]|nr:50S ribosomal protein L1 [Deltaproteobacteria bacterium]